MNKMRMRLAKLAIPLLLLLLPLLQADTEFTTEQATEPAPPQRLPLAIYYETLCPDSMYFIRRQLYDALQDYDLWSLVDMKLLPFGKAGFYNNTELGAIQVFCQHGPLECELNALHACLLEHHEIKQAFALINCMLRAYNNQIDECAMRLNVDVSAAKQCKFSRQTADILMPYGRETLPLELSFVPSIVFDHEFEPYKQQMIRYNFHGQFCLKYEQKYKVKPRTCA